MFEIPSNQEHFFEMEMDDEEVDLDFGLQTTKLAGKDETKEEKVSRNDFAEVIAKAVKTFRTQMDQRLVVAKAREGLALAVSDKNSLPPFCRLTLSCKPDLKDRDLYQKVQDKLHNVRDELLRETVELLDQNLEQQNAVLKETLKETKDRIGVSSKGAGEARTELTERIRKIKESQDRELLQFKTDIRSRGKPSGKRPNNNRRPKPY